MVKRTDLVVPADLIAGLQIPPLAITDGAADPEWVEVPLSQWRFVKLRPLQRLPLDARSARSVRRAIRLAPWSLPAALVSLTAWWVYFHTDASLSLPGFLMALGAALSIHILALVQSHGMPKRLPYRTRFGELRIPDVPVEVAQQWVARNPGVTATDEPAPRPHSRRFYVRWSTGLLTASILLVVVLANNGREDSILFWMLVPTLIVVGITAALKIQSPRKIDGVRTWPPVNVDRRTR
ncbi:hypothetical protein [Actinoplanes aureus]|uniref:Uncharacterized protein n=1 Tax=Actinoplanes aureus TaxID=2792083 RepID=A0A931C908_9ACTN|nr:hypothetical protein [Actinoplanes aureus]MBG0560560.1 hypothetical protein [Actinoplanes aureus]